MKVPSISVHFGSALGNELFIYAKDRTHEPDGNYHRGKQEFYHCTIRDSFFINNSNVVCSFIHLMLVWVKTHHINNSLNCTLMLISQIRHFCVPFRFTHVQIGSANSIRCDATLSSRDTVWSRIWSRRRYFSMGVQQLFRDARVGANDDVGTEERRSLHTKVGPRLRHSVVLGKEPSWTADDALPLRSDSCRYWPVG